MKLILASQSPRRQALLRDLGYMFEIRLKEVDEVFPPSLEPQKVPLFLAKLKAEAFLPELKADELLITSDTIVLFENQVLGKPINRKNAIEILASLSGKMHEVITAVQLTSKLKTEAFAVCTKVFFKELSIKDIEKYVDTFEPYDKAGAYGIQEWIGQIGISRIEGSFYNVMGLPTAELYEALEAFSRH